MTSLSGFTYAQARMQARYGKRADSHVWLRLHNILDLASYLQVAQQTSLRPWTLGISSTHNSHDIELTLRQKYRHHVDEVAGWLPETWQPPLQWIKRLADLSAMNYLMTDATPMRWMTSDPELKSFTENDTTSRLQAMGVAGCVSLMNRQQGESIIDSWLSHWYEIRPQTSSFNNGLQDVEKILYEQWQRHAMQSGPPLLRDYEYFSDKLSTIFRSYTFQPAAVFAYLAMVAIDIYHVRSDLMQRLFFMDSEATTSGFSL